jgi:hypothetical protein
MKVLMFVYRKTPHGKFSDVLENVQPLLSGIKWDSQGYIIGAKATILNWILKKVREQINVGTAGNSSILGLLIFLSYLKY